MRERVDLKSPVRENRPPGSVRGAPGNRRPYLDPGAVSYLAMHWLLQGLADAAAGLPNTYARKTPLDCFGPDFMGTGYKKGYKAKQSQADRILTEVRLPMQAFTLRPSISLVSPNCSTSVGAGPFPPAGGRIRCA